MNEIEIFNLIDKALSRYAESTSTLIAAELDNVRHEIRGVKDEFKQMNGKLREVCEWKAKQEGIQQECSHRNDNNYKTIGAVVGVAGLLLTIFLGFSRVNERMDKIQRENEAQSIMMMEDRGHPSPTRGSIDSLLLQ
jgi:hypothetical protein